MFSPALRYLLIELADAGVIRLHWSPEVLNELVRAIGRVRPSIDATKLAAQINALDALLPGASVHASPSSMKRVTLPDPDDVHVVGAAWEAGCSILLTFNVRDFPPAILASLEPPISPVSPDTFLLRLLTTEATIVLPIIERLRTGLKRPPLSSAAYIDNLARAGLAQTAELLSHLLPL